MFLKRIGTAVLMWLLVMLVSSTVLAQTETTTLGDFSVDLPEGWVAIEDGNGGYIISNADLNALDPNAAPPEDTLFVQVLVAQLSVLPEEVSTPTELLEAIQPEEGEFEIETLTVADTEIAQVDVSTEDTDGTVYARLLNDTTFVLVAATNTTMGELANYSEQLQEVVASMSLDITASVPEEALTRYEGLQMGTSEEGFPQLGDPDAPVEIVEISSFDCPACAQFHAIAFPTILERVEAGDVLFTYVPVYGTGSLPGGDLAASAALCAAEQDSFWTFQDVLFSWQQYGANAFVPERIDLGAEAIELDTEAFSECLDSEDVQATVDAAIAFAQNTPEFAGTPTVLVNGGYVENWLPEVLTEVIDSAVSGDFPPAEATAETEE